MTANKVNWVGVDDNKINYPTLPKDRSQYEVALEAQRIRVFKVQYIPASFKKNGSPTEFLSS